MHRVLVISGFLLAVGLLSASVWSYGYRQALTQLSEKAEADLELASDRLSTQLQVYQELAVLMAEHPYLRDLDDPDRQAAAAALLLKWPTRLRQWTCCSPMKTGGFWRRPVV